MRCLRRTTVAALLGIAFTHVPAAEPQPTAMRLNHDDRVNCVALSPNGTLLASGSHDKTVRLWDTATGKLVRTIEAHRSAVWDVIFAPDGKRLATAGADCVTRIWDPATGQRLLELRGDNIEPFKCLSFTPDGKVLATANNDGGVRLWDSTTGRAVAKMECDREGRVAFTPDGSVLASASHGGKLRLWDSAWTELRPIGPHEVSLSAIAFSPDGRMLATGGGDQSVRLWEVATGKLRGVLRGHQSSVTALAYSADGRLLASGGLDKTVRFWDLHTGRELARLSENMDRIHGLAWSRNGKMLATAHSDKTALLWQGVAVQPENLPALKAVLDQLWADLAGPDAARAFQAISQLASQPEKAAPFLAERLKPTPVPDAKRLDGLIADLSAAAFETRQRASEELEGLGNRAAPALKRALATNPELEVRQRIESLLKRLERREVPAETLRILRAIEVLESTAADEARRLLERLAAEPSGDELTDEARRAWARVRQRR